MKFLKSQNTSRYSPSDNTFLVNPYGRAVMDFRGAVMLPKGTTAERPQLTGNRQPTDANGYIRFNTTTKSFEGYIDDGVTARWETIRAPGSSTISIETFGPGDAVDTIFGPLANVPASANNVIVLVENVMQIPTTNFTLNQNPSSTGTGQEIVATSMVDGSEYIITDLGTTDFTLIGAGWEDAGTFTTGVSYTIKIPGDTDFTAIGAADNNVGTVFTATGAGSGTGKALPATYTQSTGDVFTYDDSNVTASGDGLVRLTGWYLTFTSAVPFDKNVTVFFGFAN